MSDGVVPPYLSSDWQSIRIRLHAAAAHCSAGATESTSEAVRLQVNLAFAELRDVLFALSMMDRGQAPHQHENPET